MTNPTCATCRHFRDHADAECYRFPATIRVFKTHGCGEHAPAEPVGVPQLPEGWEWDENEYDRGTRAVFGANHACYVHVGPSGMTSSSTAPTGVVLAVIAAHRARGVR